MSMNVNIDESWMPEPELMEAVPRRIVPFDEFPDRNRPNVAVFGGISGALLAIGLWALWARHYTPWGKPADWGASAHRGGGAGLVYFPYKLRLHLQRAEASRHKLALP